MFYEAAPGLASPATATAGGIGMGAGAQAGAADPSAAAGQAAQGQWASDPSYYSNYWGGEFNVQYSRPVPFHSTEIITGYYGQAAGQQGADGQHQGAA